MAAGSHVRRPAGKDGHAQHQSCVTTHQYYHHHPLPWHHQGHDYLLQLACCEEVVVEIVNVHVDHFSLILLFTMSHNPYYFRLEGHEDGWAQLVSMV